MSKPKQTVRLSVVRTEKLQDVFETALPPAPATGVDAQALADWVVIFYRRNEVVCLMLGTMSPKLYQQFKHNSPLEMVTELKFFYGKPSSVELKELVNMYHSSFVQNYNMQSMEKTISEVNSLLIEFEKSIKKKKQPIVGASSTLQVMVIQAFVQNYNMQSMEKIISEVNSLLIEFKKSIKKKKQPIVGASSTLQVMVIQGGKV
nr:hypothetical protein [Tanacetum cinerariifolium]